MKYDCSYQQLSISSRNLSLADTTNFSFPFKNLLVSSEMGSHLNKLEGDAPTLTGASAPAFALREKKQLPQVDPLVED